jgi:hypothetical protein
MNGEEEFRRKVETKDETNDAILMKTKQNNL